MQAAQLQEVANALRAELQLGRLTPARSLLVSDLKDKIRQSFVASRGWTRTRVRFDGGQLARGALRHSWGERELRPPFSDHTEWYRIGRRPVAIIEQPYDVTDDKIRQMREWAASQGLRFSTPAFVSWWYPEWTTLCVYEREGDR